MTIRLAAVFAHPDDDAFLIAGQLLLRREDIELTLVFATSGEAGPISDDLATRETLGSVREQEQRKALETIGYGDARVEWLRHPDYYLPEVSLDILVGEIETLLREVRPHVVVTFGPDGLTSHHDHMHVGAAASAAFHRARAGDPGSFQRLYHLALARSDVDRFYAGVRDGGFEYGEEGNLFDITGVPDETITVRVDTRPVEAEKVAAIREHRTQRIEFERMPEPLRWIHQTSECFVQIHPPPEPGEVRGDLLEDLMLGTPREDGHG